MHDQLVIIILTQYNISRILRVFGDSGVTVVLKELKQIHDRMVTVLKNPEEMSREKNNAA